MNDVSDRVGLGLESFRILVESVTDYAIYMLDSRGYITTWNAGAERFKGYLASEIIGQHFSRFYSEEDRRREVPASALETARESGDQGMPGMTGLELIDAARAMVPTLRALIVTGYADLAPGSAIALPRLAKPFRESELLKAVDQAMGADSQA